MTIETTSQPREDTFFLLFGDLLGNSQSAQPVSFQPQQPLMPRQDFQPVVPNPLAATNMTSLMFGEFGRDLSRSAQIRSASVATESAFGSQARTRITTDGGSLLGKSPSILGVGVQRRTPIVSDPRVRGSRVGQLAASGSYWVPARIDLDTVLSKIDSRNVEDVLVVKGPYSVRYGPGLHFVDVQLIGSPRFDGAFQARGSTSFDYQVNGEQWYGRDAVWGGDSNWGFQVAYGHRTGNDYVDGNGDNIPSSYKSRDLNVALGADLTDNSSIEFNGLRLDQTDVEYPGQAFDMDYLVTDAYEIEYVLENQHYFDQLTVDTWYNRTRFTGNAQNPGKRKQFPFFDYIRYRGFTDVDSLSSGYRGAVSWGDEDEDQFTAGTDLRFVRQELNEISSGRLGFNIFQDANSPIPKSRWTNPGVFLERIKRPDEQTDLTVGARVDWTATNVIDDPQKLEQLGIQRPQSSLAEILGTEEWAQSFATWAVYATAKREMTSHCDLLLAAGHGQRPPSLTEMYAAQAFLFLLQNGQNTATGDPLLRPERSWQTDLGMQWHSKRLRTGINGYCALVQDYITFENIGVVYGPPAGNAEQIQLKYVNTDLAVLAGFEFYSEYDLTDWLTPFATLRFVDGRDLTRNGKFATRPAGAGSASERVDGLPRGAFSGVAGASSEPLPGIYPLDSRLGLRLSPICVHRDWGVELSVRIVGDQNRVATSLLEQPTPGFSAWDLRTYWRPTERLLVLAGVENFTDRQYQEHLDFRSPSGISVYQPGINFYCGSELKY